MFPQLLPQQPQQSPQPADTANDNADTKTCSIWKFSVDADYRRLGVGHKLMQRCEEWCRERGMDKIQLVTGNPIAGEFYIQKCGFRKMGWGECIGPWYEKKL